MEVVQFDVARKARLYRFVNVHSHDGQTALEVHDPSILRETKTVMSDLLAFIETADKSHYDQMITAIGNSE